MSALGSHMPARLAFRAPHAILHVLRGTRDERRGWPGQLGAPSRANASSLACSYGDLRLYEPISCTWASFILLRTAERGHRRR